MDTSIDRVSLLQENGRSEGILFQVANKASATALIQAIRSLPFGRDADRYPGRRWFSTYQPLLNTDETEVYFYPPAGDATSIEIEAFYQDLVDRLPSLGWDIGETIGGYSFLQDDDTEINLQDATIQELIVARMRQYLSAHHELQQVLADCEGIDLTDPMNWRKSGKKHVLAISDHVTAESLDQYIRPGSQIMVANTELGTRTVVQIYERQIEIEEGEFEIDQGIGIGFGIPGDEHAGFIAQSQLMWQPQQEGFSALIDHISQHQPRSDTDFPFGYIDMAIRTGKTHLFTAFAKAAGVKTLIVVPTEVLVEQTDELLSELMPHLYVSSYYGREKDAKGDVVLTTYPSLLLGIERGVFGPEQQFLILLDEAHKSLGVQTRAAVESLLGRMLVYGFTATPTYHEGKSLRNFLGERPVYRLTTRQGVMQGILSSYKSIMVNTNVDLSPLDQAAHTNEEGRAAVSDSLIRKVLTQDFEALGLDLDDEALEGIMAQRRQLAVRSQIAVDLYKSYHDPHTNEKMAGKTAMVFCAGVRHAEIISDAYNRDVELQNIIRQDFPHVEQISAVISYKTPLKERRALIKAHKEGRVLVLCNADVLSHGYDNPRTEIVINAHPTYSIVRALQRGRNLGIDPDNPDKFAYIFELIDRWGEKVRPVLFGHVTGSAASISARHPSAGRIEENMRQERTRRPRVLSGSFGDLQVMDEQVMWQIEDVELFLSESRASDYVLGDEYLGPGMVAAIINQRYGQNIKPQRVTAYLQQLFHSGRIDYYGEEADRIADHILWGKTEGSVGRATFHLHRDFIDEFSLYISRDIPYIPAGWHSSYAGGERGYFGLNTAAVMDFAEMVEQSPDVLIEIPDTLNLDDATYSILTGRIMMGNVAQTVLLTDRDTPIWTGRYLENNDPEELPLSDFLESTPPVLPLCALIGTFNTDHASNIYCNSPLLADVLRAEKNIGTVRPNGWLSAYPFMQEMNFSQRVVEPFFYQQLPMMLDLDPMSIIPLDESAISDKGATVFTGRIQRDKYGNRMPELVSVSDQQAILEFEGVRRRLQDYLQVDGGVPLAALCGEFSNHMGSDTMYVSRLMVPFITRHIAGEQQDGYLSVSEAADWINQSCSSPKAITISMIYRHLSNYQDELGKSPRERTRLRLADGSVHEALQLITRDTRGVRLHPELVLHIAGELGIDCMDEPPAMASGMGR